MSGGDITLVVRGTDYVQLVIDFIGDFFTNSYEVKANGPQVIAVNGKGREYVVAEFRSRRQAKATAVEWRREIAEIGPRSWSAENELDLPLGFLD